MISFTLIKILINIQLNGAKYFDSNPPILHKGRDVSGRVAMQIFSRKVFIKSMAVLIDFYCHVPDLAPVIISNDKWVSDERSHEKRRE